MPEFPRSMNEILILAAKIIEGIHKNPVDYPDPPFDTVALSAALSQAIAAIGNEQELAAELKGAGDVRRGFVNEVRDGAKSLLELAENRYKDDAKMLQEIGWDERADPKSLKPGQPRKVHAVHQGAGSVELDWLAPEKSATTGDVGAYRILRETRNETTHDPIEEYGQWESAAFKTSALLMNQPRGVEIRYRVIASNVNGDGPPEDAERVVL